MKRFVIILVVVMFLKPILPVLDYIINYDFIVKELCENKSKPEIKCNGKCHLVKELAKASEDDKPTNPSKKNNSKQEIEVLFFQEIKSFVIEQIYFHNINFIGDNYANFYFHKASCSVFHPPIFSV